MTSMGTDLCPFTGLYVTLGSVSQPQVSCAFDIGVCSQQSRKAVLSLFPSGEAEAQSIHYQVSICDLPTLDPTRISQAVLPPSAVVLTPL
jgi:hypothetical protein